MGNTLTKEQYIQIAESAFNWCINKFGNPLKTFNPTINISFDRRCKKMYGYYFDKEIVVYPNVCENKTRLIKTVIHEYCHYLQMPKLNNITKYNKLFEKYGYDNHPLEVEARMYEEKYYKACYAKLKRDGII